ncbi:MAG: SET domain-containing protein-lysine N-methyltransferase [Planctomycetia bacterium]|nr:SET domain-containing protein-lysine N-methyltransferase [Planctomycetia bacterium]
MERLLERKMENRPPKLLHRQKYDQVYIALTHCGNGVFAAVAFKANQPVGRIKGTIHSSDYRSDYCMSFGDGALEPEEPYRFVNHSCEPNCELIEWEITNEETNEKVYELWLHTIREIAKNEQLTIDYGWDWKAAIHCLCGSSNCRGWICQKNELAFCIQKRGRGSLEP